MNKADALNVIRNAAGGAIPKPGETLVASEDGLEFVFGVPSSSGIYYSVKEKYGDSIGDGVIDDTVAIQKTIDRAVRNGGGIVFFPPGTYVISSNLDVPREVSLLGCGARNSIIKSDGTQRYVQITGPRAGGIAVEWKQTISELGFDEVTPQYGPTTSDYGIGCALIECEIINCVHGVEYLNRSWLTSIVRCIFHHCTSGVYINLSGTEVGSSMVVENCHIFDCDYGIDVNGASADGLSFVMTKGNIEHIPISAVRTNGGASRSILQFKDVRFERNGDSTDPSGPGQGSWIELGNNTYAEFMGCWAFPDRATFGYEALFKLTGSECRAYVSGGWWQWEYGYLVDLQGGYLIWDSDRMEGANKCFGIQAGTMAIAASATGNGAGQVINGGSGLFGVWPNDVGGKLYAGQRQLNKVLVPRWNTDTPATWLASTLHPYDAATRVWHYFVEVEAINDAGAPAATLRVFLEVNVVGVCYLDIVLPVEVGGAELRMTYRPDYTGGGNGSFEVTGIWSSPPGGTGASEYVYYGLNNVSGIPAEPANHYQTERNLRMTSIPGVGGGTGDEADMNIYTLFEYVL